MCFEIEGYDYVMVDRDGEHGEDMSGSYASVTLVNPDGREFFYDNIKINDNIAYKEINQICNNGISLCSIAIFMIIFVGLVSILSSVQLLCKIPIHFPFAIIVTLVILAILPIDLETL